MRNSMSLHSDEYSLGSEVLCQSSGSDSELPLEELRPNPQLLTKFPQATWGLSRDRVWVGLQSLCLGPPGLEKALGHVGVRLRLKGTEGAQACLPPLVSEGGRPHLGAQQASWARVGRSDTLHSSPAPQSWRVPPTCLSAFTPASFLCPQDQHGPDRASEGIRPSPRAGQTSLADRAGDTLVRFRLIQAPKSPSRHGNPFSLSATPQGRWSCLASTSPPPSVPPHPTVSLGGSSCLLGH